jgi:hypothetical protein
MGKFSSIFVMLISLLILAGCSSPLGQTLRGGAQDDRALTAYSSIKSKANNLYLSVGTGTSPVVANGATVGDAQSFSVITNADATISLQSKSNGLYLTVDASQSNALVARSSAIGTREKFRTVTLSDGGTGLVALANNFYVCNEMGMGATLYADKQAASTWESFVIAPVTTPDVPNPVSKYVSLKAKANGLFVAAGNTTSPLVASAAAVTDPQTFGLINNTDGTVSFQSKSSGLIVAVDASQANALVAKSTSVSAAEKFQTVAMADGSSAFKSMLNQQFVCADLNAGVKLYANRGAASGWESFVMADVGEAIVDFGPNVLVFDPSMSAATIQAKLDAVFATQESNQFGAERYALLFKPGSYDVHANIGFYTSIAGLGQNPDDVNILQNVVVDAGWFGGNATCNFWRSAENLKSTYVRWAVAQAAPFRRMHVMTELALDSSAYGWSSGGYVADTKVEGKAGTYAGQQWFTRNSQIVSWYGVNWNGVFAGVIGAPAQSFPTPPYTTLATTPIVREKPYLYVTAAGKYAVFVPSLVSNSKGISWADGSTPGTSLPISQFYIAKPADSAATINAALARGLNLIFTPGIYHINQTINVNRADTVVLGLGYATLIPDNGVVPMKVADVDGVKIAGLLFDAGLPNSPVLLQVGPSAGGASHAANPTILQDVFFRIGGAGPGSATTSLVINQNDVIIDHTWVWRADHGAGAGWTTNPAINGVVVNGNNVLALGLFVEHFQEYNVLWNGQNGRTIFFQNEMPYDPPSAAAWGHDGVVGWAAYKVAPGVTSHEAWGMGSYCVFTTDSSIVATRGFEAPVNANVKFHDLVTISLGKGQIAHVINDTGAITPTNTTPVNLVSFP